MKKLLLVGLLLFSGIWTLVAKTDALAQTFNDTNGHWAGSFIGILSDKCQINGYLDNNGQPLNLFKPDNQISRAELASFLVKCHDNSAQMTAASSFSDVALSKWYAGTIYQAKLLGLVGGYADGTFRPEQNVNRAEATKMIVLSKFQKSDLTGLKANFTDIPANSWYESYVGFAVLKGFVSGYKNSAGLATGKFGPGNNMTRGEAAKIIVLVNGWATAEQSVPIITQSGKAPKIGACQIFPSDNPWNRDISADPVDANSQNYLNYIGSKNLHPDFGGAGEYGIPYVVVGANQAMVPLENIDYADESDAGPYPIPADAPVENGGDAHVLVVDQDNCLLYELYAAEKTLLGWNAGSAAKFDLKSNALRPEGWTSADAAGLPVFAGLARYDEVAAGEINHALRVTFNRTQKAYIHPATHFASSITDTNAPPMGLRLRMKADYDISKLSGQSKVIAVAMKKYGLIVADNGSNWFISGSADVRWDDEDLNQIKEIPSSAFEVVQSGSIVK